MFRFVHCITIPMSDTNNEAFHLSAITDATTELPLLLPDLLFKSMKLARKLGASRVYA